MDFVKIEEFGKKYHIPQVYNIVASTGLFVCCLMIAEKLSMQPGYKPVTGAILVGIGYGAVAKASVDLGYLISDIANK